MEWTTNLRFPNLALALVAGGSTLVAENAVCLELSLLLGDLAGCLGDESGGKGDGGTGGSGGEVVALTQREKSMKPRPLKKQHSSYAR